MSTNKSVSILVLDIDGVLNLSTGVSKECMSNLETIVSSTNCQIALSSTWRKHELYASPTEDTPWRSLCQQYPFLMKNKFVSDTPIIKQYAPPTRARSTNSNSDTKLKSESKNNAEKTEYSAEYRRGIEIYHFIERLKSSSKFELASWLALDDLKLDQTNYLYIRGNETINFGQYFRKHFVWTDVSTGLSRKNALDAIEMLATETSDNVIAPNIDDSARGTIAAQADEKQQELILSPTKMNVESGAKTKQEECKDSGNVVKTDKVNLLFLSWGGVMSPVDGKYQSKCAKSLKYILDANDTIQLVLTSGHHPVKKMKHIMSELKKIDDSGMIQNERRKVWFGGYGGVTSFVPKLDLNLNETAARCRARGIHRYLKSLFDSNRFEIANWLVLDDDVLDESGKYEYKIENKSDKSETSSIDFKDFFKGHFRRVKSETGLTLEDAKCVLEVLC